MIQLGTPYVIWAVPTVCGIDTTWPGGGASSLLRDTSDTNQENIKVVVVFLLVILYYQNQNIANIFGNINSLVVLNRLSQGVKT